MRPMRPGACRPQASLPPAPPCRWKPPLRGRSARALRHRQLIPSPAEDSAERGQNTCGRRRAGQQSTPGNRSGRSDGGESRASEDGRPGGGRNTPQGSDAGSIPERTLAGSVPTAASTWCLSWRGERSSRRRSNVQRLSPHAGCNGSGKRIKNQPISESANRIPIRNRQSAIRDPVILFPLFAHLPNRTPHT